MKQKREWIMYAIVWPDSQIVHLFTSKIEAKSRKDLVTKGLDAHAKKLVEVVKVKVSEV